ncbi:MAG: cobalt-precorrin-5B (C(1))-methyltransferase CbiD [Desulfomonile sp.]|nr:cobalt-precorrin-5B (C(1))-methyltransferase CbiD [Desulfomonile sp.]
MKGNRTGFTTGTCASVAAKAATMLLATGRSMSEMEIGLPDGARVRLPVEASASDGRSAWASVRKDAGDDPDITDGCIVTALVKWNETPEIRLLAGEGIGTVTKPGLAISPGEPAINPVPRGMIKQAVREVTDRGVDVTLSIPGGRELAKKTFNPRLGVVGGLSILGTSGIVRPFSHAALRDALKCGLSVAVAGGVSQPVFVPGRIGEKAARRIFELEPEQVVEVSNEWGFILDEAADIPFERLLIVGHPGKLAKLMLGWWDTHSSRSASAVPAVQGLARSIFGEPTAQSTTVEGIFRTLPDTHRKTLADALAAGIRKSVHDRIAARYPVAVLLVDLSGTPLGQDGDIAGWRRKPQRS